MHMPFTRMDQATDADWARNREVREADHDRPAKGLLAALRALDNVRNGSDVTLLTHSLQAATRAERDGASDELVFAALCHDLGQLYSRHDHAGTSATLVQEFVSRRTRWIIRVHNDLTSRYKPDDRSRRSGWQHRLHPGYRDAFRFVDAWDQRSFDPHYDTEPLEHFEPLVRRQTEHRGRRRPWRRFVRRIKRRAKRLFPG
jgi:predicted HD phosphohydrolase